MVNVSTTRYDAKTNDVAAIALSAPGYHKSWRIVKIICGYSSAPTGGLLTITNGSSTTYLTVPVGQGFNEINLDGRFPPNSPVTVSLAAGGAGIVGHLNVFAVGV
jgi:hypothetical protein